MIFALLPMADFKTVQAPVADAPSATLGIEIGFALLLLLVLLLLFLAPRLWQLVRTAPKVASENWILIDGSNVMHWQDNTPRLEPVLKVIVQLRRLGYVPGVVFDANAGWKLFGRYVHDEEFAMILGLEARQVLVVAKGTQADPFLLRTAREFGARIVTNDRFRDWAESHPEVARPGFLIRGRWSEDGMRLQDLEAAS